MAKAEVRFKFASAVEREQIRLKENAGITSIGLEPGQGSDAVCTLNKGARGSIVARQKNQSLVVFDEGDWRKNCKGKGLGGQFMGWVPNTATNPEARISTEGLSNYGDRCAAYEFLENQIQETKPEAEAKECKENCGQRAPLLDLAAQMLNLGTYHEGNRCLIENRTSEDADVSCSFDAMMKEVKTCEGISSAEDKQRCVGRCVNKLNNMACSMSPWKTKSVEERFQLIMKLGEAPARLYGVDARMMPCVAIVETGYLEPMAKTGMACINPRMNRYHGLGMITQQTLENYLNPSRQIKVRRKALGSGKLEDVTLGPFRSVNPLVQKESYYACPTKLHDLLGSSPDLQLELMAYTLAEKLQATGGSEYRAYMNYNGLASADAENGKPHMENYADAVNSCVSCLRQRYPKKGVSASVECLAAGMRSGGEATHPFQMAPGKSIFGAVTGFQKRYCGEGK